MNHGQKKCAYFLNNTLKCSAGVAVINKAFSFCQPTSRKVSASLAVRGAMLNLGVSYARRRSPILFMYTCIMYSVV